MWKQGFSKVPLRFICACYHRLLTDCLFFSTIFSNVPHNWRAIPLFCIRHNSIQTRCWRWFCLHLYETRCFSTLRFPVRGSRINLHAPERGKVSRFFLRDSWANVAFSSALFSTRLRHWWLKSPAFLPRLGEFDCRSRSIISLLVLYHYLLDDLYNKFNINCTPISALSNLVVFSFISQRSESESRIYLHSSTQEDMKNRRYITK